MAIADVFKFYLDVNNRTWNSIPFQIFDSDYGEARSGNTPVTISFTAEGHETISKHYDTYDGNIDSINDQIFGLDSETTYTVSVVDSLGNSATCTSTNPFTTLPHPTTDIVTFNTNYGRQSFQLLNLVGYLKNMILYSRAGMYIGSVSKSSLAMLYSTPH